MELTETKFWEDYWQNCELPSLPSESIGYDRALAHALETNLVGLKGEVFEVGCAPGKWLAFLAQKFVTRSSGIEYTEAGMQATLRNLDTLGVPTGDIFSGDFFIKEPEPKYDLVMSFGFIEHFDNPDEVVRRHLRWLKPNGTLVIGVPNFNGIYRPMQAILDQEILDKHNLSVMNLDYFKGLAERLNVKLEHLEYIGSFEPSLPISKPGFGNVAQFLIKAFLRVTAKLRRSKTFDGFNNSWISSSIIAIYKNTEA